MEAPCAAQIGQAFDLCGLLPQVQFSNFPIREWHDPWPEGLILAKQITLEYLSLGVVKKVDRYFV